MKMMRIATLLSLMLMISVSAFAERKTTRASIDLRFGDETYTSEVEVSWDEQDDGVVILPLTEADSFFLVNKDGVPLRTTYSLNSAAKTTMDKGTPVQATRKYSVSGEIWYYITVKKSSGIVYSGYVRSTMLDSVSRATFMAYGGLLGLDSFGGEYFGESYRLGDTGNMVIWIQKSLTKLKYYEKTISGNFGIWTEEAVRQFQSDNGLSSNGVADYKTIDKIMEALNEKGDESSGGPSYNSEIYNVDWYANRASIISGTGTYKLTDIATGRTFSIKIQSAGNHADVEPLTASDTEVLCSLYGVANATELELYNKYQRRAVVMTNGNGEQFIGSIYAIPHGKNTVIGNDFDGQFCVHFLNSKTHGTDRVDTDAGGHQDKIKAGAAALTAAGYTIRTIYPKDVYNVDWFEAMKANNVIAKDEVLTLGDIVMNVSFQVKVQAVGNHADVEPLQASDTEALCSLYGVANATELETHNKYQRRAVLVTNSKGEQFIGSIYAIPHGLNTVTGNNFDGQFCVHFLNSTTHSTNRVDTDEGGHQDKIAAGAAALKVAGCTIQTTYP